MAARNPKQNPAEMNVPLMRRVAETLVASDPATFGRLVLDARGDVVTLKGRLPDADARNTALALARGTGGVSQVVDQLIVAAPIFLPDSKAASIGDSRPYSKPLTRSTKLLLLLVIVSMISPAVLARMVGNDDPRPDVPRPAIAPVAGTFLYEGRPAVGARLVFHPLNNDSRRAHRAMGVVASDGRFELGTFGPTDGAAAGEYAVTVEWPTPEAADPEAAADANLELDRAPVRFRRFDTTPLRVAIAPSTGSAPVQLAPIQIALQPDPAAPVR